MSIWGIGLTEAGAAENMVWQEIEDVSPKAGEVLIKVAYAGVNRPDVFQRLGLYPPPPGASPIMGLEASGEIIAMGEGVTGWQLGDKVCALCNGGAYAQHVAVPAEQCLPVPEGLSMAEAAALPETCFTVWTNVFDRGRLQAGENFLVHGGASGIGTTAIQMAKALGAKVFATVGSEEKKQACLKLGADVVWNYQDDDFVELSKEASEAKGIDVILDMVGGDYIQKNMTMAAKDGRIVSIAFLRGAKAELDFRPVMAKRLSLTGSTLRPQTDQEKAAIAKSLKETVWPLIEAGKFKPLLAKEFSIQDVAEAHQLMESNALIGKVVLAVE
ncbi:NAD(P)H-quinone oxidoreductase [uncultured Pseudoteredinibacter sp.]|uniref:NAD(P)H-quinone oxidoreductase n=1 Tax=uncultured Pseudoteredinibacter sp. TaxID=1641701 RepID=UPI002635C02A|nr:NAD(P)H-quinone oxidoreductase [uncultured Pseudoteredinibacter sp.]